MNLTEVLKRDNNNLDLVRIIVATMVIWSHAFALNLGSGVDEPLFKFLKVTYAGELGVNIFFFLSGLLVTNSILKKKSVSQFLISRFFRIFPALLALLVITTFFIGPFVTKLSPVSYFSEHSTWLYFIQNLYLKINYFLPGTFENNIWPNDVNGSLWTLPFEVACYLFLVAVFILSKGSKWISNSIIIIILVLSIIPGTYLNNMFNREYILAIIPIACFAVGSFFAINQEHIHLNFNLLIGFSILSLLFWRFPLLIDLIFPITISVFMLLFSTDKIVLKLIPKYDISYGLYIWHFLVQQIIFTIYGPMNVYLFFLISFIITAIISLFSYILIEHGAINLGYRIGKKFNTKDRSLNKLYLYSVFVIIIILLAKFS